MTGEKARTVANALLVTTVLSLVIAFGGCVSCIGSLNTESGSEEFYKKPNGSVGYGAESHTTAGEGAVYFAVVPFIISVISAFAYVAYSNKADKDGA
jgi:amino acid transporter